MHKLSGIQLLFLIIILGFSFAKTYSLHFDYRFPYHHDEWQHLARVQQIKEQRYNIQYNPYLGEQDWHFDLESGFHLFTALLFLIGSLDPLLNYQFLAAIFAIISSFFIFYCVYKLSKNFSAGLFSIIIFLSIKTNINILGSKYFVPLTMAVPFIFFFTYNYVISLRKKDLKRLLFSFVILFCIFLIHPPSALILTIPASIEFIFNHKILKKFGYKSILAVVPILALTPLIWKGSLQNTLAYSADLVFFETGWGKVEIKYFIPLLFGLANTFFALVGILQSFKTKLRFFVVFAFTSLSITAFFNIFNWTFLIPYQRAVFYAMLSLVPLSAIGLNFIAKYFSKHVRISKFQNLLVYGIFIFLIFSSKYDLNDNYENYGSPVLNEDDFAALKWFEKDVGSDKVLITPFFMTSAVYPVSKNKVIFIIPSHYSGGQIDANLNFYVANFGCAEKKSILASTKAEYVFSRHKIECDYLELLYDEDVFIYEIK